MRYYLCLMETEQHLKEFLQQLSSAFTQGTWVKLTLSKPTAAAGDLRNVYVRPVRIGGKQMLSFTLRYATRDETKNFGIGDAVDQLQQYLPDHFLNADFLSTYQDLSLQYSRKRKAHLYNRPPSLTQAAPPTHDTPKNRLIRPEGNIYLQAMGIVSAKGEVTAGGQRKYRQIDKYIEIIDSLLQQHPLPRKPHIVDMGAGKGYLTFALYDHLSNNLGLEPEITGLEIRPHLVESANALAAQCGFTGLHFEVQDINQYHGGPVDMLIALHACDTLTDAALAEGIATGAGIILAAPCCHKQIRKQMHPQGELKSMLKHGILQERQAELLTDSIRALLLEAKGYRTKVFEFVSIEHTNKNLMIAGTKSKPKPEALEQVDALKRLFGIEYHYLEKLLK